MAKGRRKFLCLDCHVDTGRLHEHYFVHTAIWLAVVGSLSGMLCVGCLEDRLGRRLSPDDFPAVTINDPRFEPKSLRLLSRLKPESTPHARSIRHHRLPQVRP